MDHGPVGLALIIILGIASQWLAHALKLPSILVLLAVGVLAGPVAGVVHPDEVMGGLMGPFVSLSVGIILFEGGLSLKLYELKESGVAIRRLIILGSFITLGLTAWAGIEIAGLSPEVATLLGAILVVTGPTVIVPLLQQLQLGGKAGSVLRWEGMMNDPLGAVLAVLVFEYIWLGGPNAGAEALWGLARTALAGILCAAVGTLILYIALRRFLMPDHLQSPVVLMVVVGVFAWADTIQTEAGLLATTLLGLMLANQTRVTIKHIVEFKENLRVLLIAVLFILLAARIPREVLLGYTARDYLFVALQIFLVRPLAVGLSTLRSTLDWRERLFLAAVAPRGIVAAAVSSLFALRLAGGGVPEGERLLSLTFLTIAGTVLWAGLVARPLARKLELADPDPQGLLLVGAHPLARALARVITGAGCPVTLVDTNRRNIRRARREGLTAFRGSILSERTRRELDLDGVGRLLALTSNDEVNSLAVLEFLPRFGRARVYQLPPHDRTAADSEGHFMGRELFHPDLTHAEFVRRWKEGWRLETVTVTQEGLSERFADNPLALLVIGDSGIRLVTTDRKLSTDPGERLLCVMSPRDRHTLNAFRAEGARALAG